VDLVAGACKPERGTKLADPHEHGTVKQDPHEHDTGSGRVGSSAIGMEADSRNALTWELSRGLEQEVP
jgi:hypothetical protein